MTLLKQSMTQFRETRDAAIALGETEASCAALATLDANNQPKIRTVHINQVEDQGFVLCVTSTSQLLKEMLLNPYVALSFYWPTLPMQANVQGRCILLPTIDADRYWHQRSNAAFPGHHGELEQQVDRLESSNTKDTKIFYFKRIARPNNWRVVRIEPLQIEFKNGGWRRQNGTMHYHRSSDGHWHLEASSS